MLHKVYPLYAPVKEKSTCQMMQEAVTAAKVDFVDSELG